MKTKEKNKTKNWPQKRI